MGMIDRGASMGWLSQYPHEQEITFAPLTGLEVVSTKVERTVLVVQVRLNINLQALTIEEVVSKRHKLIRDIAENMVVNFRPENDPSWHELISLHAKCTDDAKQELLGAATAITELPANSSNDDKEFGRRVNAIVAARGSVDWSSGLTAVLEKTGIGSVAALLERGTGALGSSLTVSCCGLGDELMSVVTVLHKLHYLDGLSEMDITQNGIGPRSTEQWCALLDQHDLPKLAVLTNWGNKLADDGLIALSAAIRRGRLAGLTQLRGGANQIGDDGYAHLMETLATGINPRLTVIGFYDNGSLGDKAIVAMGHAAAQGHLQKLEKTDLSTCCFGDEGLMALCEAEKQTHAFPKLQELRIAFNFITDKGFLVNYTGLEPAPLAPAKP